MPTLYEITNIARFDTYVKNLERNLPNIDSDRNYVKACQMVTEIQFGFRKNTHMAWRRVQSLLSEVEG